MCVCVCQTKISSDRLIVRGHWWREVTAPRDLNFYSDGWPLVTFCIYHKTTSNVISKAMMFSSSYNLHCFIIFAFTSFSYSPPTIAHNPTFNSGHYLHAFYTLTHKLPLNFCVLFPTCIDPACALFILCYSLSYVNLNNKLLNDVNIKKSHILT